MGLNFDVKVIRLLNHSIILLFLCCLIISNSACRKINTEVISESPKPTVLTEQEEIEVLYEDEPEEDFEVDLFFDSETFQYHYVYDNDYLNILLDYETVSLDEMFSVIDQNDLISDEFKPLVKQYCIDFVTRQPEAETRVLYENLKTLNIITADQNEIAVKTLSNHSAAGYDRNKNTIYILEGQEYIKGTWEYQVLYHELSHAARTGVWDIDMIKRRVQCEGVNFNTVTCAEALNSLFAVSLFDYEEESIAYQLQSNYVKTMIDSLDDYQLSDYMNRSLSYFVYKLGEFNNGDFKTAVEIMNLIETQYKDIYTTSYDYSKEVYYPIYDYISRMYYKNRITAEMSHEEAYTIADELTDRIMKNVDEIYQIPVEHFYQYFEQYYKALH